MGISFRKPIITRGGNRVKIYHVYEDSIHGAYENEGKWYVASWQIDGFFHPSLDSGRQMVSTIDLINDEPEDQGMAA